MEEQPTTKPTEQKDEKVIIETSADLYKLPISTIKNTKVYNFKGKYFDQIYEEALKIERSGGLNNFSISNFLKKDIRINSIIFEMKYQTQIGQELGVIGSLEKLGNWNQDKALSMGWTEGNVWTKEIVYDGKTDFEYKYIFVAGGKVQRWEDGLNRKFELNAIKNLIENAHSGQQVITIGNSFNNQNYSFDTKNNSLKITSVWNLK